ncbi:DUF4097 domain-containing protein [Bacillus spongiae]|uniref:DUF4097 domain-containing protein n=1 Tax=Bacillus spongiae TaxID=2683610 RepID=A0ABU8HEF9_9BACI
MNKERKRILEMVESGALSAQEALTLLEALDQAEKKSKEKEEKIINELVISTKKEKKDDGPNFNSTKEKVMDFVQSTLQKVKNLDLDFQFGQSVTFSHVFQHSGDGIQQIELDLFNGNIEIIPWDQRDVRMECHVKVYRTEDVEEARKIFLDNTTFSVEKGHLFFLMPYKWIKIDTALYLPKCQFEKLSVKTFNGGLVGKELIVNDFRFKTANGKLRTKKLITQSIDAETANGALILEQCVSRKVEAETIHGSILFQGESERIDLQSLSGTVECELIGDNSETLHMKTVTGNINMTIPNEQSINGELKSNLGNFNIRLSDITILEEKNELVQKQLQFTKKGLLPRQLHVFADTKTGSVKIQ